MPGDVEATITTLREAAQAMRGVTTSPGDEARAIQTAINALQAAQGERLAEMDATRSHEDEGASSISTWARRELHIDAGTTRQMVRAASTFQDLPDVGEAARRGELSFEHVRSFTYALKHVGHDQTRQLEQPLLDIASSGAPNELFTRIRRVRDVLHADDLDDAWLKGMERRDIKLSRCGDGWHLTGFLDIETGTKLTTILTNLSVPRDRDDDRAPAERRMDALDDICTTVLEHGLPADNGIRPHINITVEAPTTEAQLDAKPAVLERFGSIGPQLLAKLACGAELTPFLVKHQGRNTEVLDVGHSARYATTRQAKAIRLRQAAECASPGCKHPIAHNHHVIWWSHDGPTDLDLMVGLCRKCHTLVHSRQLDVAGTYPDGFTFTHNRGSPRQARAA